MKSPTYNMTAAQAIVEVLKREGVNKVFCVPCESYLRCSTHYMMRRVSDAGNR